MGHTADIELAVGVLQAESWPQSLTQACSL